MIEIVEIKNPFEPNKKERKKVECTDGTLYSYLDPTDKDVYLNGILVLDPVNCFPQDGNQIVVTPHIGKSIKGILGMVAMLALAVYAPVLAAKWLPATASKLAIGLMTGAITMVGGKLINSMLRLNQIGSTSENSQSTSYGWSLPSVQTYEGGVIAETYGECIPTPQLLMCHVETTNTDDQDKNVQYLNLLYCGGWGPVDSISNIRIGTTPIENFTDVQIETRLGENNQEPISFFPTTVLDQSIGLECAENKPLIRTTDTKKAKKLEVTVEFPNGLYKVNDSGDYDKNTAEFQIMYRKTGTTEWKDFGGDDSNHIVKSNGRLSNIVTNVKSIGSAAPLEVWTLVAKKDKDTLSVTGSISGKKKEAKYGEHYDNGIISFDLKQREIFMKKEGTITITVQKSTFSLTKATSQAVRRSYQFEMPEAGQYDIRVVGTKLPTTTRATAYMTWSTLSSFIMDSAYSRPGKVLIGLRIKATNQLSGGIPNVNWRQIRNTVHVFDWDTGTYVEKDAKNPIWAAYDMLHNCKRLYNINTNVEEYVVEGVPANNFKQYWDEWKSAAAYADEEVLMISGEKERRFRFDAVMDTTQTRWEAAQKAATSGRATILRHGTQYGIVVDRPSNIVQVFGEGQIVKSSFKGEYSSRDDRARSVEITYNDTDNDYKNTVFMVRSPNYANNLKKNDNTAKLSLFGVTRRSQAYREGMYLMATNERQLQTVTFGTDIGGMVCEYGDVIGINHAVPQFGDASGRIVKAEGNTVVLDKFVELKPNKNHSIMIRLEDDSIITKQIQAVTEETNTDTITVIGEFSQQELPKRYDPYMLGEANKEVKPFRITKITKNGDNQVTITATEYDAAVYELDYSRYPVIDYAKVEKELSVKDIKLTKIVNTLKDGTVLCDIKVDWVLPISNQCKQVQVYYKRTNEETYTLLNTFSGNETSAVIRSVLTTQNYMVRIICLNDLGIAGPGIEKTIYIAGKETAPAVVKQFTVIQDSINSSILHLQWAPNQEPDIYGYRLYDDAGKELVNYIGATNYTFFATESKTYTFGIKAINTSGIESETATKISIQITITEGSIAVPDKVISASIELTKEGVLLEWTPITNTYIDFYEVRSNSNTGDLQGLIVKSNSIREIIQLKNRKGDLLIYGHNPVKGYGPGLNVSYDFQKLEAPIVTSVNMVKGFALLVSNMPSTANSIRFYIVGSAKKDILNSTGNTITYTGDADIYRVKAAFIDAIGEGIESNELLVTVSATIDPALLDKESLGLKEFDKRVNELSAEFNKVSEEYSVTVKNLKKDVETKISQLDDGIDLKVTKGLKALDGNAILSRINLYEGGVKIDGKLIHITGDTLIDGNIITNKMLQANSITADKLKVDSLSALSAYIGGTLRGGKLIGTEIQNESGTFKVDEQGNIYGVNITGSRIDANSVYAEGQQLKPVYVKRLDVSSGDKIELPAGYSWDKTLIFLRWISGAMDNDYYAFSGQNMGQNEVDAIQRIAQERFKITLNMRAGWGMNGFGNDLVQDNVSGANEDIASKNGGRFISFNQGRPVYGVVQYSSVSGERPPVFSVSISQSNSSHYKGNPTTLFALGVTEKGYFYYGKMSARQGGWGSAGITIMSFW
ncbi:host specificity factor TipJ family phage tail protein [uncultured Veillonella sp.]|jgi:predicted phage tail protein|uniref:host specificity factor TipJ family phage tail protein n=1 Tax=uncultured Veillonella sp. TaxID=159268 RepID=UPI002637B782|nr:host specificity factor TipJ family phage tail protein [uncultured Veillonella sp.]